MKSKVYIINNSGHDYSLAEEYGELIFLTEGNLKPFSLNQYYRILAEKMKDATLKQVNTFGNQEWLPLESLSFSFSNGDFLVAAIPGFQTYSPVSML